MRFKEETIVHRGITFTVFHDACVRWHVDVRGHVLRWNFDFATGFDPVKERGAAIELGQDFIERVL